ncbi:group 1 glycosyl transferase [Oceanidesulfovibrio indonesiensis]|uniref:Group 1 glycosyl transferase n=1 Tax=Oceanidesulfovibrio indonesiensis TaxID=54767 RepID=A0A7M3MIF8_9BACT|nr:GT4 family glycosyltransferase PelF [Oceanidesulfovibrio indonesiensis]TVM19247.1 group 1 glycosyl transferase [Oceanidesulfovibrio indonesiensis]
MTHDVCFILEGTYPFVSGGVSSWVHSLVKALPEINFTALCIMPSREQRLEVKYVLPRNFRDYEVFYLHDPGEGENGGGKKLTADAMPALRRLHEGLGNGGLSAFENVVRLFRSGGMSIQELMHGKKAWDLLLSQYGIDSSDDSFIDYFWTYRISHLPLFRVLQANLPDARVYHSLSTGYAGVLGAIAHIVTERPFLLTEHGIYFKERRIEIAQADWIFSQKSRHARPERDLNRLHGLWMRIFQSFSLISYHYAERIFTLFEGNRETEIADGADPDKIEVLPNAIAPERFYNMRGKKGGIAGKDPLVIGFVGRIVPIKDLKTFIRAIKIVAMRLGRIEVRIMGPTDEDPSYAIACRELVRELGLQDVVRFLGKVDVKDHYPELDLLVLTSMSEAQPLVLLEAPCAGIPCVATDVGACRELLEGRNTEDRALGPSGMISRPADPIDTARCIAGILGDPELWEAMSEAGRKRVVRYYSAHDLYERYETVYREHMARETQEV